MSATRCTRRSVVAVSLLLAIVRSDAGGSEPVSDPIVAVWRVQRVSFTYRSANVQFSCETLSRRTAAILIAVGARKDIVVNVRCPFGSFTNDASMVITIATPIEATPSNIAALTTHSTEKQLAARLNNLRLPTANDIERFPAIWSAVKLERARRLNLQTSDCDLLQGLADQVFPHLAVRMKTKRVSCSSGMTSHLRPTLHVAALMAATVVPLGAVQAQQSINASLASSYPNLRPGSQVVVDDAPRQL